MINGAGYENKTMYGRWLDIRSSVTDSVVLCKEVRLIEPSIA